MKRGTWTPDARVLCSTCHGPNNLRNGKPIPEDQWKEFDSPPDAAFLASGGATSCSECGEETWLGDRDVVLLKNLADGLPRKWNPTLQQTGGMNVALDFEYDGKYYTVFPDDNDQTFRYVSLARRRNLPHGEVEYENMCSSIRALPATIVYQIVMQ